MRSVIVFLCSLLVSVWGTGEGLAQQRDSSFAFTYLAGWPAELRAADADDEAFQRYDLLPFVDTLALGYAAFEEAGRPGLRFSLAWTPGPAGVYDGARVPYEDLPEDLRIVAVDLRADVFVGGEPAAALMLALDSLALAPTPDRLVFEKHDVQWNTVFSGVSEDEARAYFAEGFTLHNLHVVRIAFASYAEIAGEEEGFEPVFDPRYPTGVGVYPPDAVIWVDWVIRPGRRSAGKRGTPAAAPERTPRRGVGRTPPSDDADRPRTRTGDREDPDPEAEPRTRTGDRDDVAAARNGDKGKKRPAKSGKTKDEDDDDTDLLPAALAGAAAIGVLAYVAGTIGYYGNTEAPLGLTAGYVRREGGVLLQVAVNTAVLGTRGEPETLIGKLMGFYGIANVPVQPALGVGVLADEDGDAIDLRPSLSFGLVGNFGTVVLFGGYDLAVGGVDFGLAFNFRSRSVP